MRLWLGLLVLAGIGCKKRDDSPASPPPSAVGDGDAVVGAVDDAGAAGSDNAAADAGPPPPPPFCLDREAEEDVTFREVAKDATSLTFCLDADERMKCATLDLASGHFTAVHAPPPPAAVAAETPLDTSKLDLPTGHEYATAVSPDGKTIAAITDLEGKLFLVDATTGKVKKIVRWRADGGCMEPPSFIGDHVYVQYNVCAGPGATGWIVTADGKKLGSLRRVNPTGTFHPIGNDRYAFEDFGGSGVEFVDGKNGKSVGHVAIEHLVDCDDCASFRTDAVGLVQVGDKLVQFGQQVTVIDPAAMQIEKTITWPLCAKVPAP